MELGDRATFPDVTFLVRPVMFCHVLFCSVWDLFAFCVRRWGGGTQQTEAPSPPFFVSPAHLGGASAFWAVLMAQALVCLLEFTRALT